MGEDARWGHERLLKQFMTIESHFGDSQAEREHGCGGPICAAAVTESSPERRYSLSDSAEDA